MSRFLVLTGVASLAVLVVIAITGGFVFHVGPLRVSAHSSWTPLALALLAWTAAFARGRVAASTAAAELLPLVERHAAAVALLAAVAAAGVGVAHGTYAAAGADASGYVSEAALFASGRVVRDEPFARTVRWPDATWTMSPLGYRPGRQVGELVPTYPPGLALATAVATLIAGESGAYLVVPLLGALAVWCTYLLGVRLHSRPAGLVGAVLLATSPIFLFQVVQPMSDVAVAAWWALAFTLSLSPAKGGAALSSDSNRATISSATGRMAVWPARGPVALPSVVDDVAGSSRSAGAVVSSATNGDARSAATDVSASLACGATAGLAILTRPNLLPLVLPLALLLAGMAAPVGRQTRGSSRLRRLAWFGVGLLPAVSALLLLNWRWYGAPFASGYGTVGELFAAANVLPNARAYASKLLSGEPAAIALAVASLIVLALRPQRAELRTIRSAVVVAALTGAIIAACYLPYGVFTEWFYLRFLLPAFPMAAVCAGALAATAFPRIPPWLRGTVFVLTLAAVAAWNVKVAAREQAFNLARYEARYRVAGRYLASALPDNAVVLTVQHSGSVPYYTGLPIVRWDRLADDLDSALAAMRALGRRPVLLIEEWEASQLRERFPRSLAAQLDWPPLAEFGTNVRVRVYDPADRGKIPGTGRLDRLR